MALIPVGAAGATGAAEGAALAPARPAGKHPFVEVVEKLLGDANSGQLSANLAVQDLAAGRVDNVHDVMLAVAKADLMFRTILEVRNRLTEAYQEVMRMQV